jgi:DNA-binding SARP family transcriptional activator
MLLVGRTGLPGMNTFPIVGARIHPPLLRSDVLSRERLNTWLEQAVAGRLALIVAEAGFGKTTLLADWASRTRRLTAWYRLEPDDRDWLTFARHLVASGRELDPQFAPETYGLLMDLGPGGPTREAILASLVTEIAAFGAAHSPGLTLIFDDYHVVDGSDEVVPTVRALLDLTGPQFSIVIATRSTPKLPLSRMRARGAISRLTGDALCFETSEADRLFRDAYRLPLERDVVEDLVERTDGWVALLSLVRANLEEQGRPNPRALVSHLDAGAGDLYDYLAEEVLAHLSEGLRDFLVRASLLDDLDPFAAGLAAGVDQASAADLLSTAEDLALIQRPDLAANHRFAPLVRDFLRDRLQQVLDEAEITAMHQTLARQSEDRDWRRAATHYRRAGEPELARKVVSDALEAILATGQYRAADDLLAGEVGDEVVRHVLRSRVLLQVGAIPEAIRLADQAVQVAESASDSHLGLAAQNAAAVAVATRRYTDAIGYATLADSSNAKGSLEPYTAFLGAAGEANLPALARQFEQMLAIQIERRQPHYAAITSMNLAQILVWLDRTGDAIRLASNAERHLQQSSRGYEAVSVRLAQAQARAFEGDWASANLLLRDALATDHPEAEKEAVLEGAELAAWFGPDELATELLQRIDRQSIAPSWVPAWKSLDLWLEDGPQAIAEKVVGLEGEPRLFGVAGATFRWHLTLARAYLLLARRAEFHESMARAERVADLQGSPIQRRLAAILRTLGENPGSASRLLSAWPAASDPLLGVFAPQFVRQLGAYSETAMAVIARAAVMCPQRWREPMRRCLDDAEARSRLRAASVLEVIGEQADITRLKDFSRRERRSGRTWGDALVKRLAPRLVLEDLGPSSIHVGNRQIQGRGTRRKVLALLLFLASQPNGSATPEQVLEAMWPDLKSNQGINSVHQTIYFLRRIIDRGYRAGLSPEYVHFNSDVIWLDRNLVDCRSWICRRLLLERPASPNIVEQLLANYHGRFAPEFAYEEWTAAYRDGLHAAFLSTIEQAIAGNVGSPDLQWRLWVGQRALMIDAEADAIEALTIRLYRALGAPAAAAEQYTHYAAVMREQLGIDPPPIEDL